MGGTKKHARKTKLIQWQLKYQTRSDFEWLKVIQMLNGSHFEWHSKSDKIDPILKLYVLVPFLNSPNHSNTETSQTPEHQNIQILNEF